MENELLVNNEEVEERIRYERTLAMVFVGMKRRYRTWNNFRKLNLTDTKAIAKAFEAVYFYDRTWENLIWLLENTNLKNDTRSIDTAFRNIIYQKWDNLKWMLKNTSLNNDPRSIAKAFSYLINNTFDDLQWLLENTSLNNDPIAIATAFYSSHPNCRTYDNFLILFEKLNDNPMAIAIAFSALFDKNISWDFFEKNILKKLNNNPIAIAKAVGGLCGNEFTWNNLKWLINNTILTKDPNNPIWENFQWFDDNTNLANVPKAISIIFSFLKEIDRTFDNLQWLFENTNLKNDPKAIKTAFDALRKDDRILNNFQCLINKLKGNVAAIAVVESCHNNLSDIDQSWNYIPQLNLADTTAEQITLNPTKKCKTWQDLKREFGQKSPTHIDGGVTLGILAVFVFVLLFLHIFCPPAAVIIDGTLATVGIGAKVCVVLVPVTAGSFALGSGVLSAILFYKRFVFPEASNDVKMANSTT